MSVTNGFSQEPPAQAPQIETQEQPKSRLEAEQPNDQKTDHGQQPPLGIEEIGGKGGQRERRGDAAESDQQGSEFWPALFGYRLKVTDTLLIAVTFLLFWATLALWLSTRRLVRGAEITAKRQLRAYVVTRVRDFEWPHSPDGPVIIFVEIKNTGQTPAHDVRSITRTIFVDYPFGPDFDFSVQSGEDPSAGLLGPDQTLDTEAMSDPLTKDDWLTLKWDKTKRLCTYGTITYRDVFDDPQYTNFCISHVIEFDETSGRITSVGRDRRIP